MSNDLLFWIYLINSIILINHEIDSAYWQEWKLINADNSKGINGFLIMHIPMLFLILIGLLLVYMDTLAGLIISLLLSVGGVFAFCFHFYFIRKGRSEFNTIISKTLIISTFFISIFQLVLTIRKLVV